MGQNKSSPTGNLVEIEPSEIHEELSSPTENLVKIEPLEIHEELSCHMNGTSLEVDVGRIATAIATHGCSEIITNLLGGPGNKLKLTSLSSDNSYIYTCKRQSMGYFGDYKGEFSIDIFIEAKARTRERSVSLVVISGSSKCLDYSCTADVSIRKGTDSLVKVSDTWFY
jgi:hypothetical protein